MKVGENNTPNNKLCVIVVVSTNSVSQLISAVPFEGADHRTDPAWSDYHHKSEPRRFALRRKDDYLS